MFLPIFLFELRYRLRRPATWIYFGLLLLMGYLLVALAGGTFGSGVQIGLGGDGQADKVNSSFSISIVITILSVFGIIIASSLMGNPVYRDFEHRTHSLFYTKPLSKWGYLGGRFLGSYAVAALVFSGLGLGAALGATLPGVEADRFLASAPAGTYLWPYVLVVLPNLFFTGAIFFTLATLTRIGALRQAAPDSLQPLLTDLFDRITLYDKRVLTPTARKLPDGRYQVRFTVRSAKFYADSLGQQHPAPQLRDDLPVAIFPEVGPDKRPPAPLLLVKRRLHPGLNQLEFIVARKPATVAVDPYHELVDRDLDDNTKDVKL